MADLPTIFWDVQLGRFRNARGQLISSVTVRAELDKSLLVSSRRVQQLGSDLRAGRISLEAWRQSLRDEIKAVHLRSAALAKGGWDRMTPADFGRVGQKVRSEYGYLENWTEDIKAGAPLDGRLNSRGAQYTLAARGTFHQVQRQEAIKRGQDLERNVLGPTDQHCAECLAQTALGAVEIGTLVPIGDRTCLRNCQCAIVYQ